MLKIPKTALQNTDLSGGGAQGIIRLHSNLLGEDVRAAPPISKLCYNSAAFLNFLPRLEKPIQVKIPQSSGVAKLGARKT